MAMKTDAFENFHGLICELQSAVERAHDCWDCGDFDEAAHILSAYRSEFDKVMPEYVAAFYELIDCDEQQARATVEFEEDVRQCLRTR